MRILLIEDNEKLARSLKSSLEHVGYLVDLAFTADDGEEQALVEHHDVILLDLMLHDRDGVDICRHLRRRHLATPILMLTVLGDTQDRVRGLDAGADDYVCKPFQLEELLARIRSLLRRAQSIEGATLRSGDLEMKLHEHRVTCGGAPVRLSSKEFALLEFMMRNPERLLTRSMISESVWDMTYESSSNVIEVYVCALRRKLDRDPEHSIIETVIGSGYRFHDRTREGEVPRLAEHAS